MSIARMQVWKNRKLRFKLRTIAAIAMACVLASNLGPLEAKASGTVISCPGGGSFTVSDNGAGEVYARDEANSCGGNVVIPEGVTRIGLFQTPNISRIEIPASVRSIDGFAFANSSLATVVIAPGSNLTNISGYAFANTRITSFRVPAGVTSIDGDAFSGCASLTSFTFEPGNQLQFIGLEAFRSSGLTSLNLPESVTTIERRAFYEAQSLTSVSFGANSLLTTLGEQAFASTALTFFAVGSRVQSFNFQMVPPNTAVTIDSNNPNLELRGGILFGGAMTKLINYPSSFTASSYVIPSTVTEIATDAFRNARFTSVTIPDSVTTIGWRAFEYSMLESVTIPASVTSFGLQAFLGTSSLRSVTFAPGSALTRLGYRAFQGATNLTSIDLRPLSSLVTIEYMAFVNTGLTSAALPASLESIEQETFMDSGSLSTVTFEASSRLRHIGEGVFRNTSVSSIAIPATPVRPGYTFVGWTNYQNEPLQDVLANVLLGRGTVASWQEIVLPTVTAGSTPDSQVASIPTGLAVAEIPATATLPKVVLSFATTSGTATATVVPSANPAAASATPFMVTNTTKIVDINLTGVTGPVTVCLDGAATDNIFHFTGGAWVALPQRSYVNGQVCGVTTNFSPFVAAEPRALTPVASSGPVGPRLTLASRVAVTTNGQSLALKGVQLSEIFSVKLSGKDIKVIKQTDGELVIEVPASAEGFPTLELKHSSGTLTYYRMIEVIKPYELTRSIKITKFVGSRPTLAGLSALYKVYRVDTSANVLTCVMTVASDASAEQISNAEYLAKETCQRVVRVSNYIKTANIQIKKEGAAGSKPVLAITFDRTLNGK